jgi:hypothetical protein
MNVVHLTGGCVALPVAIHAGEKTAKQKVQIGRVTPTDIDVAWEAISRVDQNWKENRWHLGSSVHLILHGQVIQAFVLTLQRRDAKFLLSSLTGMKM